MTAWGEITIETHTTAGGFRSVRIKQADEHCLIHPNLLMACRQQEYPWARVDGDQLTLNDGMRVVAYRIGNPTYDGWNSGIRLDLIEDSHPRDFALNRPTAVPGVQGHLTGTENGSAGRTEAGNHIP